MKQRLFDDHEYDDVRVDPFDYLTKTGLDQAAPPSSWTTRV